MYDSRLGWLKYFLSDDSFLIVTSADAQEASVVTLLNDCATDPGVQIVEQPTESASFVPLSIATEDKPGRVFLYLINSRESSRAIGQKLAARDQEIIVEYSVMPNWKNPRWFVPKERSLAPGRMSLMINPSRPLSRAGVAAFRILKGVACEQMICPARLIVSRNVASDSAATKRYSETTMEQIGRRINGQVHPGIIYTGSFGPIQKFTLEFLDERDHPVAFAKIGQNTFSKEAIDREGDALKLVQSFDIKTVRAPQSLGTISLEKWGDRVLVQEILVGGNTIEGLSKTCVQGLIDLFRTTQRDSSMLLEDYLAGISARLNAIEGNYLTDEHRRIRDHVLSELASIAARFPKITVPQGLSHGDFTRWNVRQDRSALFVIDWEEAAFRAPGHDLFNLLFSETLQAKRQGSDQVIVEFSKAIGGAEAGSCEAYFDATLQDSHPKPALLAILYLAEKLADSLWHVEQHRVGGYPEKDSFDRIITTSERVFRYFLRNLV